MLKYNLIVAVCENFGIGIRGDLPWKIKSELRYFSKTTKRVKNANKKNAVIMGKRTYFGIPQTSRPLSDRLNIILSTTLNQTELPKNVLLFGQLEEAMKYLENDPAGQDVETVWIVGGSGVYREAMESPRCHRIYLTKINSTFECDTFFPEIPKSFHEVDLDPETPLGIQEENGIHFEFKVLENE